MIIAIFNQKGGVGKTTTTLNLGAALARRNRRVLLLDLDSQANLSASLAQRHAAVSIFDVLLDAGNTSLSSVITRSAEIENLALVPGARALAGLESALRDEVGREYLLREALEAVSGDFDDVLIDNGPTLGLAPAMALCASDLAVIPLQCERLALEGLGQTLKTVEATRRRINPRLTARVLLTMVDGRLADGKQIATELRTRLGEQVCRTEIRTSSKLKLPGSVFEHAANSEAARDYRDLAEEVLTVG
jgi:chromosome partitioning protein